MINLCMWNFKIVLSLLKNSELKTNRLLAEQFTNDCSPTKHNTVATPGKQLSDANRASNINMLLVLSAGKRARPCRNWFQFSCVLAENK